MEKLAAYVVREGALSTSDAVGWIARVCLTLAPIHVLGVAHGRVSTKAIQISAPSCASEGYLLDAGDLVDDPAYLSPERLRGGPTSPADDCWALGVTLYSVLTGQLPFAGTTRDEVLARIDEAPASPLAVFDVGDDTIQSILDRVFAAREAHRLRDLDELRAALAAWDRSLAKVTALNFGKPSADDDDDDAVMTSVYQFRGPQAGPDKRGASKPRPAAGDAPPKDDDRKVPHDSKPPPGPLPADEPPPPRAMADSVVTKPIAIPADELLDQASPQEEPAPVSSPPLSTPAPTSRDAPASTADPTSAEPMVSTAWPPRRDHVLAEAEAQRVKSMQRTVLIGALVVGGIGGGIFAMMGRDGDATTTSPTASTSATTPPDPATTTAVTATTSAASAGPTASSTAATTTSAPTASASSTGSAAADPTATPTTSASATPSPPASRKSRDACAAELFPADTFEGRSPDFAAMCLQTDPVAGAATMHRQVVVARGIRGVTDGMREWSIMRWYAMASFAIARARCCEAPAPLMPPPQHASCKLGPSLEALGTAVKASDEEKASEAVAAYQKAVNCLFSAGAARTYQQRAVPTPIQATTFQKMLARALKR